MLVGSMLCIVFEDGGAAVSIALESLRGIGTIKLPV